MLKRTAVFIFLCIAFTAFFTRAVAQPMWTIDPFGKEKKPEKYETRKLGSEKTADKKFTTPRHFIQNTITHYNYYFNANNKINAVVENAKLSSRDDYSRLLSFYPYALENTAAQKQELDSIIYRCTAGILLHDLRNDWIDNMYLIIGKSYFYKKDFDSAAMTFQFINYNLFPRKKNEDDSRVVGTNDAAKGSSISIANKEKRNLLQKFASLPPSRNDALIWLTRTLIEQKEYGESAGLINTLQNDPNLPRRLKNDLDEVTAYWNFKQGIYDSAAVHLEKAISNADDKLDKSRREFLLAQLYEISGNTEKASEFYGKASKHTVDPLMDIYAQLNDAKMYKSGDNIKALNNSISNLAKMGRRDKFESYRDIIYYSAGELSLKKPDSAAAIFYYNKSIKYNETNITYKNKAYLALGDIAYKRHMYKIAAAMYDSLQLSDTSFTDNIAQVQTRRAALSRIVGFVNTVEKEDSLQRIAAMSPAERELFVRKLVKKIRKENGLKEDAGNAGTAVFVNTAVNNTPVDMFANNSSKGEWYFYNGTLKSRGFNEFKSRWGTRANADNWRRKAVLDLNLASVPGKMSAGGNTVGIPSAATAGAGEITYESLMENVPLTTEKKDSSNIAISNSLLGLAKIYKDELEDYSEAVKTYEEHLQRFPDRLANGEIYLGLYYSYTKLGNTERAEYYKNLLNSKFSGTRSWQMVNNPAALDPKTKNPEATKTYENIYDLFLEGKFDAALAAKKNADSLYGVNYWTPQLLYIEALYNVKQRNDSLAIVGLNTIIQNNTNSPLKEKAATMIDVLKRRKEIETYLTNLQVTRAEEEQILVQNDKPVVKTQTPVTTVPAVITKPAVTVPVIKDTLPKAPPLVTNGIFIIKPDSPHHVIMILEKVDPVYVNESKNAFTRYNNQNYYGQPITISKESIDADHNILVISSFPDGAAALQYYEKIKRDASREVSWLPANKYSFVIISNDNLQLLKANKDITGYRTLLNKQYPGKF